MKNFIIHTMGCKSNQFEGSIIKENLIKHGMLEVRNTEDADVYILNSCSVTHKSDSEALYLLRNAKHKKSDIFTVITGCLAQIEKSALLENDFIDCVIGNDEKLNIYEILQSEEIKKSCHACDIMNLETFHNAELNDTSKTRASLKIQDGCDNRCSYCIIPFARGKSRSADSEVIINQIKNFENHGFKEVVFTGIHIGLWGKDFGMELLDLLKEVEDKTDIPRYRLGSLNPLEINDKLLDFLSKSKKFCPHFHLSLQSACDKTLRSMNRFYNVEDYLKQIEEINNMFDLPFLGSDIIAGFAGETDTDFAETCKNLEKSGLSQIHTFPYSVRKGTVGADMPNQIPEKIKEERATIIKNISKEKFKEFLNKNLQQEHEILIEKHPDKNGYLKGVTRNYLTVITNSKDLSITNTLQKIKIIEIKDNKPYGILI